MLPLLPLLAALSGCVHAPASSPEPLDEPPPAPEPTVEPGRAPWIVPSGPLVEAGSGLSLTLPEGWEARPGRGAFPWEARDLRSGATLFLGTWTGNVEELEQRYDERPLGFVAEGTQQALESVADGRPWISTREAPEGLRVGWYLVVEGRPVAIEAVLPADGVEQALIRVVALFTALHRGAPGT